MKKILLATAFISALYTLTPQKAFADVYNCDGIYKTTPCEAGQTDTKVAITQKTVSNEEKEAAKATSQKKSLIHELAMKAIKANREYKISYNTGVVEDFCSNPQTSVSECHSKVIELTEKIDDRAASLEEIKAQKRANELNEEKLKQNEDQKVVIINQQYYDRRYRRTPRPYIPRNESGYDANIQIKSRDGNRSINGSVSGGHSVLRKNNSTTTEVPQQSPNVSTGTNWKTAD